MSLAIVLDTETTDIDEPEVIELAVSSPVPWTARYDELLGRSVRFKPSKRISLGALATHHILDEDLQSYEPWPGQFPVPEGIEYVIGHNVDFDWKAIGSPKIKRICTLALARSVWPDLDSHSLGALTYQFSMNRQRTREVLKNAHSAMTDVGLCMGLLHQVLAVECHPEMQSWEDLWLWSERARVPVKFTFGKHEGRLISEIRRQDPGYIRWMCGVDDFRNDPYLMKALRGVA